MKQHLPLWLTLKARPRSRTSSPMWFSISSRLHNYAQVERLRSPLSLRALRGLAERIVSKQIVGRHHGRLRAALLLGSLQLTEILLRGSSLLNSQRRTQATLPSSPSASSPFSTAIGPTLFFASCSKTPLGPTVAFTLC